jgi:uncharacterized membrane protein (UPF0127 family)
VAPAPLAIHLRLADSAWQRLRGLIGTRPPAPGEGLLLPRTGSVHTCLMSYPIDIVFLDRDLVVVGVAPAVPPWRVRGRRGARAVLELAAGGAALAGIGAGDRLIVQPCAPCSCSLRS